ncbi:hypothetical protein CesoFtcFv8_015643 [Champsocephalus esox]|uniref:Fibronectin type-III domain-containing protein n=1 Tax=Champsocephalus esox TaxID=159716 RepID=A0AAN8GSB0_9TELE|nr:hypothetical protein CesoFtcFv8_015643 [Champsocephalus esox]
MPPGEQARPPSMLCGEDGQWVGQPVSSCSCRPGYETGGSDVHCRACPSVQFKAGSGPGGCSPCPANSNTLIPGSAYCLCHHGLRRAAASESSLTVEWNQNQSPVLDYQLRYSLQEGSQWQYLSSSSSSVVLSDLQRGGRYFLQVRARNSAGFGPFSAAKAFSTTTQGGAQPVVTGVLVAMGILLLIAMVTVTVICYR